MSYTIDLIDCQFLCFITAKMVVLFCYPIVEDFFYVNVCNSTCKL